MLCFQIAKFLLITFLLFLFDLQLFYNILILFVYYVYLFILVSFNYLYMFNSLINSKFCISFNLCVYL
jgi:hypothetical protein